MFIGQPQFIGLPSDLLLTRGQQHTSPTPPPPPLPQFGQLKMSPDIAKCLLGGKTYTWLEIIGLVKPFEWPTSPWFTTKQPFRILELWLLNLLGSITQKESLCIRINQILRPHLQRPQLSSHVQSHRICSFYKYFETQFHRVLLVILPLVPSFKIYLVSMYCAKNCPRSWKYKCHFLQ